MKIVKKCLNRVNNNRHRDVAIGNANCNSFNGRYFACERHFDELSIVQIQLTFRIHAYIDDQHNYYFKLH